MKQNNMKQYSSKINLVWKLHLKLKNKNKNGMLRLNLKSAPIVVNENIFFF